MRLQKACLFGELANLMSRAAISSAMAMPEPAREFQMALWPLSPGWVYGSVGAAPSRGTGGYVGIPAGLFALRMGGVCR